MTRRSDPWWDLEGSSARRIRVRQRVVAGMAFLLSFTAVLGAGYGWVRTVTAASVTVNLDQWASLDAAWQNGNLNGNNSRYPEGGVIPFRLAIEGLKAGDHSIRINYDFTASGHKAYDFLATWNATNGPGLCGNGGGGVSSMCPGLPSPSSAAFPSDGYRANGLSVTGAEVYSGASRRLTIYGGTITGIDGPEHDGSPNGNSTGELVVRFSSSGSAVLLAWGGHLAQSAYWDTSSGGPRDGASMVSGAPWHMRTLQLDGSGNRNQDRSIQPSAVVGELPPFALAPAPPPTATPRPPAAPTSPPAATPRPPSGTTPTPPSGGSSGGDPGNPGSPGNPTITGSIPTVPPTATASTVAVDGEVGPRPLFIAAAALTLAITALLLARPAGDRRHRPPRRRRR